MYDINTTYTAGEGLPMHENLSQRRKYQLMGEAKLKARMSKRTVKSVIDEGAKIYGVEPDDIKGASRARLFVRARHWVMYHALRIGRASSSEVGKILGSRHHASVLYGAHAHAMHHNMESVLQSETPFSRAVFKYIGPEPKAKQ